MNKFLLLFLTMSTLIACRGDKIKHSESQALYNQVMEVHDEVMPKMSDIRKLSKKIKKIDGYKDNPQLSEGLILLDDGHEAMMEWMHQFKMPKDVSLEEEMTFLNAQLISAKAMSKKMKDAISNAEQLLDTKSK